VIHDAHARPAESSLRVVRLSPNVRRVELSGALPIGWLGNFTCGATAHGLDIVRGHAQRAASRNWSAELEVRSATPFELERVDFFALARTPSAAASEVAALGVELLEFELGRASTRADMLELQVRARDRVGFLAALLEHLAGFVLFPDEISIDTHQGEAQDTLVLSSVGGQSPSPEVEQSLRSSMNACRRERGSLWPSM